MLLLVVVEATVLGWLRALGAGLWPCGWNLLCWPSNCLSRSLGLSDWDARDGFVCHAIEALLARTATTVTIWSRQ